MTRIARRPLHDDDSLLPAAPPLPRSATPGQRWRFRRNLSIYLLHRQGLSQRFLADVFDLPRSRIGEILKQFAIYEKPES